MSPIVWELALVVGGLVVFAVWQTVTLKRDMRLTREARLKREAEEASAAQAGGGGGGEGSSARPGVARGRASLR